MSRKISIEIKEEVLGKIKCGGSVREVANQYGISTKSIYTWLGRGAEKSSDVLELSRLKRENEALTSILGRLVYEQELAKKNWSRK